MLKSKEEIILMLLISLNAGDSGYIDKRVNTAIQQYEQLVEKGIIVPSKESSVNEEKESKYNSTLTPVSSQINYEQYGYPYD